MIERLLPAFADKKLARLKESAGLKCIPSNGKRDPRVVVLYFFDEDKSFAGVLRCSGYSTTNPNEPGLSGKLRATPIEDWPKLIDDCPIKSWTKSNGESGFSLATGTGVSYEQVTANALCAMF